MSLDNTTAELVLRVRDICDEDNETDITSAVVIRMLNRAQQELVRLLTKHYKNHFMREVIYSTSDFTNDANGQARVLALPRQAFGFAVNSVDVNQGGSWFPLRQVPFSYTVGMDLDSSSSLPLNYAIQGDSMYVYPTAGSGVQIRVRYQFRAPQIVSSEGRITSYVDNVDSSDTLTLDTVGSNLGMSVDDLSAFVNVIDHLSGEIKATMQVSNIVQATKTLTFTQTNDLQRSIIFGYSTTGSLPTNITVDDYICLASGTCVPYLAHDLTNFLIELAAFYVKRKMGSVDGADYKDRDEIYKAVQGMQFGREYTKKISRTRGNGNYSMQSFFRGS